MVTPETHNSPACFYILPEGPSEAVYSDFRIVACRGMRGDDWAVYFGPSHWTPEMVQRHGEKLPHDAAKKLFPNIKGEYRN